MKKRLIDFLTRDVWRIRLNDVPRQRSFLIRNLRIVLLALRGFNEDYCSLRASALTFYSLLSVVPVFALAFGIAKGFGLEKALEKQILEKIPAQNDVIINVINFSHTLLENAKGGVVAGVGVIVLFWTVIKVLGNIERSFNDIWGIKKMRPLSRKLTDYLAVMLICPVLLIVSSSVTVFVATQAGMLSQKIALPGMLADLLQFILSFLPYTVIWLLFSFIYIFIPHTKVNITSALLAGVAAGTIYQLAQWTYVHFQVGVAKYNAIYGSFAALPLFLIWLQLSWRIVLLGAEVSFAHQNVDTYEFEPDCLNVSHSFKNLLALRIVSLLTGNFSKAMPPLSAQEVSRQLGIPIRLVRDIIFELTETGVLATVREEADKVPVYQPASDINLLTIKYVVDKLENRGTDAIPVIRTEELEKIKNSLQGFSQAIAKSAENLLLKDI
ncbi:MAG: ribonuclease BN [Candidatus Omnitrophica bacterium CG11_big_fil_rev_8_21_14_0_20_42_13]|uniref:Ribonuclease BN n=1 Tax=Candidatus Ghiorseimicrobium undicola TaxID=1974746 RepID=A0A2H0LZ75_9BACT|nr:MAG: ribonuclease BN [Candidatus Omnitrophica bacterium CG11_big_fil_rev_8_21_14_0_20_42_13]